MPPMPIQPSHPGTPADAGQRPQAQPSRAAQAAHPDLALRHAQADAARHAAQPPTRSQDLQQPPQDATADKQAAIRGRIFALKDGTGYVIEGTDGHYYRLESFGGQGLISASASGLVDDGQVNLVGGPVSRIPARARAQLAAATAAQDAATNPAPPTPEDDADHPLAIKRPPLPPLPNANTAAQASQQAHTLMQAHPDDAIQTQANLDAAEAFALLR